MERIRCLLDPQNDAYSYRQALVRLWILASDDTTLNHWEQYANEATMGPAYADILAQLESEQPITEKSIKESPLALIRALDDYLASTRLPSSQCTPTSQFTRTIKEAKKKEEEKKSYWLIPVSLAARRQARMDSQPTRCARWFHHHAVLPSCTAFGIHVNVMPTRSQLDTVLAELTRQDKGQLRVWIAHFDDQADVCWDRTRSPIGNWRSTTVEPHQTRQTSMLKTLEAANQAGAQIVIFPEFTLDLTHRKQLVQQLRQASEHIQLVVAGAFHEPENTKHDMPAFNTAPVLNGNGKELFHHQKLRLYGEKDFGAEFVEVGNRLHILVTPIGCMTVLICKDFCDVDKRVDNLLAEVPVDWVWVHSPVSNPNASSSLNISKLN